MAAAVRPPYWARAKRSLAREDPTLARIIAAHPRVALATRGDPFTTLARSIVGQQISVKAAESVWGRFSSCCGEMTPRAVLRRRAPTLQHFVSGRVDPARFAERDDEDIIAELVDIRGIGRWTAEMFLIFNLLRPNVLPLDDLGLLKAVSLNYFDGAPMTGKGARAQVSALAAAWEPWRSVATWYLWRSLDPVPVEY
jgi:DNA-3-methyladenine glycosylase II